jgi:hypothetical protein
MLQNRVPNRVLLWSFPPSLDLHHLHLEYWAHILILLHSVVRVKINFQIILPSNDKGSGKYVIIYPIHIMDV